MAKLITVFNQKGGCGKTQLSMQIGGTLGLRGMKVLVVDMDRQGTSVIWAAQADAENPFPAEVVSLAPLREQMIGELRKRARNFDVIIIDCPPAVDSPVPWAALNVSDLALIPIIPVMDNIWAAQEAKELARRAKQENLALSIYCIASMMRRGRLFDLCIQELAKDKEIPILKTQVSMRNIYPESQLYGCVVSQISRKSPAADEVDSLVDEILGLLEPTRRLTKLGRKEN